VAEAYTNFQSIFENLAAGFTIGAMRNRWAQNGFGSLDRIVLDVSGISNLEITDDHSAMVRKTM